MSLPGRLGLVAALAFLSGCGPVAQRVVDAQYRKANLAGRLLRVMPIDSLKVHNMDDFRDDFGGEGGTKDSAAVLSDLFGEVVSSLVDRAEVVYDPAPLAPAELRDTVLPVPAKKAPEAWTFRFPSDSALRRRNIEPDMVLQVSDLQVHRNWRPGVGAGGLLYTPPVSGVVYGGGSSPPTYLYLRGRFVVWDYRAGAPIAYGALEGLSSYSLVMNRGNWEDAIAQAVYDLLKGTPLMSSNRPRPPPRRIRTSAG